MPTQPGTKELLEGGIVPYFEAVRALRAFRKEVLKQSREALKGKLPEMSTALHVRKGLRPEGIRNQALPNLDPNSVSEDDYTDLCAFLEIGSDCELYVGLEWKRDAESGEIEPWAIADLAVPRVKCDKYWENLTRRYPDLHRERNEIYIQERCRRDQVVKLQVKLERFLDRWCVIWRKTGGIAAITRKA
jgi:hypothetical protein